MRKVRVGIAGANGAFGSKHMDAISAIEDAKISAVMATSMAKADKAADRLDVPHRFDDFDAWLMARAPGL